MSQLCFDRSSLIINVVLLRAALEVIVPVSTVPTRAGFDCYTWWEKHSLPLPSSPSFPLSIFYFFYLSLSFELSRRGLTVAFTHLYLHTHALVCLVSLQSSCHTVVGMCHSSIIDQIQLPSSTTDHLEIHHCVSLSNTLSPTHTGKLACSLTKSIF